MVYSVCSYTLTKYLRAMHSGCMLSNQKNQQMKRKSIACERNWKCRGQQHTASPSLLVFWWLLLLLHWDSFLYYIRLLYKHGVLVVYRKLQPLSLALLLLLLVFYSLELLFAFSGNGNRRAECIWEQRWQRRNDSRGTGTTRGISKRTNKYRAKTLTIY